MQQTRAEMACLQVATFDKKDVTERYYGLLAYRDLRRDL